MHLRAVRKAQADQFSIYFEGHAHFEPFLETFYEAEANVREFHFCGLRCVKPITRRPAPHLPFSKG
jgi:hypothetical protein